MSLSSVCGLRPHGPVDALCAQCHASLALFLLLLGRSARPPSLHDELQVHIGAMAALLAVANRVPLWQSVRRLLDGLVRLPALASRTELVLELAHQLSGCDGAHATWRACAMPPPEPRRRPPKPPVDTIDVADVESGGDASDTDEEGAGPNQHVGDLAGIAGMESMGGAEGIDGGIDNVYDGADNGADVDDGDGSGGIGTGGGGGTASVARAGGLMLLALFGSIADARPPILSHIFDALAQEDATPTQRGLWCALLTAVASTHLHALHAHSGQLVDWTCCLPSLPADAGKQVLSALLLI